MRCKLKATTVAIVQLGVPVIAALGEPLSLWLVVVTVTILGGIALVIREKYPLLAPSEKNARISFRLHGVCHRAGVGSFALFVLGVIASVIVLVH